MRIWEDLYFLKKMHFSKWQAKKEAYYDSEATANLTRNVGERKLHCDEITVPNTYIMM
jgi:hypothetical protein